MFPNQGKEEAGAIIKDIYYSYNYSVMWVTIKGKLDFQISPYSLTNLPYTWSLIAVMMNIWFNPIIMILFWENLYLWGPILFPVSTSEMRQLLLSFVFVSVIEWDSGSSSALLDLGSILHLQSFISLFHHAVALQLVY